MYDIITFGSASYDIFLKSKKFLPISSNFFAAGRGICFNSGSKVEVEDIFLASGGGGTNAAATLAKQGFKVAYCGILGKDIFGDSVIKEIKKFNIGVDFIKRTTKKPTNVSVFLAWPGADRTILVYRGASDILAKKDVPWRKIKTAKWFYLAPLVQKTFNLTQNLVDFAKKNGVKVAFNPGYSQLTMPKSALLKILIKTDVLILNKEEASLLTGISHQEERNIFKKISEMTKGIAIMTKGGDGALVSDGKFIYKAKSLGLPLIDATGAGDAFGAGFISGLIKKNDIEYAFQLAMANSSYSITKWGAKEGLLKDSQDFRKVKITKANTQNIV